MLPVVGSLCKQFYQSSLLTLHIRLVHDPTKNYLDSLQGHKGESMVIQGYRGGQGREAIHCALTNCHMMHQLLSSGSFHDA